MRRRLAVAVLALVACAKHAPSPPAAVTIPAASSPPAGTPAPSKLQLLVGRDGLRNGAWTGNGDVVALTDNGLWRFRPGEANGKVVTVPATRGLASARAADLVVVVGKDSVAYPFKDGRPLPPFPLNHPFGFFTISDDGRVFVERERDSDAAPQRTGVYDVATGKPMSTLAWHVKLSPGGQLALTDEEIVSTSDGKPVFTFRQGGNGGWARTAEWVDGKLMTWGDDELVLVDPATKSERRFPAKCPPQTDVRDEVRPLNGLAFRYCEGTIFLVTIDGAHHEIHVDPAFTKKQRAPASWISADGTKLLLDWNLPGLPGKPIYEVDIESEQSKRIGKLPPLQPEDTAARILPITSSMSPDRKSALDGMAVLDLATGKETMRFGRPNAPVAKTPLVAFVHDDGLEVAADLDRKKPPSVTRVGPERRTPFDAPLLEPQGACPTDDYEPSRHVSGRDVFFTWPYGGACVCDPNGCTNPHLPDNLIARRGTRFLREVENGKPLVFVDGKKSVDLPVVEPNQSATFFDDDTALTLTREWPDDQFTLRELALEPPAIIHERRIPGADWREYSVAATAQSVVVVQGSIDEVFATVYPRGAGTKPRAKVIAWPGQAIVQLDNGNVEVFGAPDAALACVESDGAVRPFSTCRGRFESKGVFRVD